MAAHVAIVTYVTQTERAWEAAPARAWRWAEIHHTVNSDEPK